MARFDRRMVYVTAIVFYLSTALLDAQSIAPASPRVEPSQSVEELRPESERSSSPVLEQVIGQPAGPAPTPRHTGIKAMLKDLVEDVKHLPSQENLFWAGVGGGLALAVHPADDNVNRSL